MELASEIIDDEDDEDDLVGCRWNRMAVDCLVTPVTGVEPTLYDDDDDYDNSRSLLNYMAALARERDGDRAENF